MPAGPERDLAITTAKGHVKQRGTWYDLYLPDRGIWVKNVRKKELEDPRTGWLIPYSTHIAAAMELWESMKYAHEETELTFLRSDEEWLMRLFTTEEDIVLDNCSFVHRAPTFADAISGVWLKCKESE